MRKAPIRGSIKNNGATLFGTAPSFFSDELSKCLDSLSCELAIFGQGYTVGDAVVVGLVNGLTIEYLCLK